MSLKAQDSLQFVKGVGPRLAELLARLDLRTVGDFYTFYPRTFDDRRNMPKIRQLQINENYSCLVNVISVKENKSKRNLSILVATVNDETGTLKAVWFNQKYLMKSLKPGSSIIIKGKVEFNMYSGEKQMSVSECEVIKSQQELKENLGRIVPIYNQTNGLSQGKLRKIADTLLRQNPISLDDGLPTDIKKKYQFPDLVPAIKDMHFPASADRYKKARHRLIFEEFFYYQCALMLKKRDTETLGVAPALTTEGRVFESFRKALPYPLTRAQERCIATVLKDVGDQRVMNRLLQGDVGSGKTDVAIATLLSAIQSGKKAALLAPTQILAEQHFFKLTERLESTGIQIVLIKGKQKQSEKNQTLKRLGEPDPCIVVGTHALIEDKVKIDGLAVTVIDEQHKFGVNQRMALKRKGLNPHCLFMTATPIPRTFTLTSFGDLDKSVIDEMPPGRTAQKTYMAKPSSEGRVFDACRKELSDGCQMYVVFPLIDESEKMDLKSAVEGFERIQNDIYPEFTVGLLHGRMSPAEKTQIMSDFKQKKINILVSTTVIEVGVDVPNATIMMIFNAERFGLSQLHQLRGRIGRGGQASVCYLIAEPKNDNAKKRIKAMLETTDGFKIAEYDLLIRGPGDMLGTRQAGLPEFKVGDIIKDQKILLEAREDAYNYIFKNSQHDQKVMHHVNGYLKQHYGEKLN